MPYNIFPGDQDWQSKVSWGGIFGRPPPIGNGPVIPTATPPTGSWADKLVSRLNSPAAQLGLRILANNRPGVSVGANLGQSYLGYQQDQAAQQQAELQRQLTQAQIAKAQQPSQQGMPSSVAEYEYATKNGFQGSFQDWLKQSASSPAVPADIQNYKYWLSLSPEERKNFTALQRQPTLPSVIDYQGGKAWADRVNQTISPVSTAQQEGAAQGVVAENRAVGQARGEATGALEKKGINAKTVIQQLDLADPLIDAATGSLAGAGADKLAAVFGEAPKGAQAIAQLQVIQAGLMLNMPRMEGPQSDRDTMLYREAAGQIGDPKVPRAIKKAAVITIRKLQEQYSGTAGGAAKPKETAAERAKRLGL